MSDYEPTVDQIRSFRRRYPTAPVLEIRDALRRAHGDERLALEMLRLTWAKDDQPPLPSRQQHPWMNGWPRMGSGVLIGTACRCVCCGRTRGITTVAFEADWQPPGPEPAWPFGEDDCPLCAGR